jgi:RNA polymerase sigma factor (sigma-70 family)
MPESLDFEELVNLYYAPLHRFALSLARQETEAFDLVQQTFYIWAAKGHQLKNPSKVKSWLFTTLHREYLERNRRSTRFPHYSLEETEIELTWLDPNLGNHLDSQSVLRSLGEIDALFRAPVALFYLEDYSYKEIAEILGVPLGTVKSRISRGIALLQSLLSAHDSSRETAPKPTP